MSNQTAEHPAVKKQQIFRMTLQGKSECIGLGRELVRGLGTPAYIKLLISENYDELVFTPCNEKEVMSFKVPNQNNVHHMGMERMTPYFREVYIPRRSKLIIFPIGMSLAGFTSTGDIYRLKASKVWCMSLTDSRTICLRMTSCTFLMMPR